MKLRIDSFNSHVTEESLPIKPVSDPPFTLSETLGTPGKKCGDSLKSSEHSMWNTRFSYTASLRSH